MKGSKTTIGQVGALIGLAAEAMKDRKKAAPKNKAPTKKKTKTKKKVSKGSADAGEAWKVSRKVRSRRTLQKVDKKLKKKIDAINDHDKPFGEYRYISDQQLRQQTKEEYNHFTVDNNGILFDQFTPMQIWDAASVCFNEKVGQPNFYAGVTQGWTNNIRYKQTVHVTNAYTKFEFKSTSSHVVNLEMYICTPRSNAVNQTVDGAVTNQTNAQNDFYFVQEVNGSISGRSIDFRRDLGVKPSDLSVLHRDYIVECVKFKFDPGEHKTHFLQGPKGLDIDGTKYAAPDGNSLYNYAKFAKFIFFKVINDQTVCGGEGPAAIERVARFPSNYQGGLAMRQTRSITVRMPDTTDINSNDVSTYAGIRQNMLRIGRFIRQNPNDVDQQVLVQNPAELANYNQ